MSDLFGNHIVGFLASRLIYFPIFQSLCTPLGIFSKSAQILELYRRKDPGRLSITTWTIAAYGCYGN